MSTETELRAEDAQWQEIREGRDRLLAEVKRLRVRIEEGDKERLDAVEEALRLRDQLSRLREETNGRISDLVADYEAADEALTGARQQRDAIADALLSVRELFSIEGAPPDLYRDCVTPSQRLGAATAWDWVRAKVKHGVEAALGLAGRLSE